MIGVGADVWLGNTAVPDNTGAVRMIAGGAVAEGEGGWSTTVTMGP